MLHQKEDGQKIEPDALPFTAPVQKRAVYDPSPLKKRSRSDATGSSARE